MLVGVLGLVNEASCRWKETVLMVFSPDGPQPPVRGGGSENVCVWGGGVGHNLPAHLRFLEEYRSWRGGRLQLITFSAELMIPCSLPLSLALAAAY